MFKILLLRTSSIPVEVNIGFAVSIMVWTILVVSVALMGPTMWLLMKLRLWLLSVSPKTNALTSNELRQSVNTDPNSISLSCLVWFVISGLLRQSTTLKASTDVTRLLFVTWWLFTMVITSFYTANMTAHMTLSALTLDISSLQQLQDSQLSWLATSGGAVEIFVREQDILQDMKAHGRGSLVEPGNFGDIVKRVEDAEVVYIDEMSRLEAIMMADYEHSGGVCHVLAVPLAQQPPLPYSLSFAANSSHLQDLVDPFIRQFRMLGLADKWRKQTASDKAACDSPTTVQGTRLRNTEMRVVYLALAAAYAAGLAALIVEMILKRRWCISNRLANGPCRCGTPDRWPKSREMVAHLPIAWNNSTARKQHLDCTSETSRGVMLTVVRSGTPQSDTSVCSQCGGKIVQ